MPMNARPQPQRTRVLLVDDHPLVRERLAQLINREPDLIACGEAEDRHHAIEAVQAGQPGLVIIDLTLKNSHGIDLIKDIHSRWPDLLMLVVSMHDESVYAERALRAGARGYITKQEAAHDILRAIRHVLAGKIYLNDASYTKLIGQITSSGRPVALSFTDQLADRELQVFELTGRGFNTRQIAQHLHLSSKTVETYRLRIRHKLELHDPAALLQAAIAWTHQHGAL
jgi:DNA-binding NarL/FixJ family response regulator